MSANPVTLKVDMTTVESFSNLDLYAGMSLPVIGDIISPKEMVDAFVRVTAKKPYTVQHSREKMS